MHLDAILVIPFDHPADGFPLIQNHDHGGAALHLLQVIKILGIGLLWWRRFLALHACAHLVLHIGQGRTDQSSIHVGLLLKPDTDGRGFELIPVKSAGRLCLPKTLHLASRFHTANKKRPCEEDSREWSE